MRKGEEYNTYNSNENLKLESRNSRQTRDVSRGWLIKQKKAGEEEFNEACRWNGARNNRVSVSQFLSRAWKHVRFKAGIPIISIRSRPITPAPCNDC